MMESPTVNVKMIIGKNYVEGKYASENSEEVRAHYRTIASVSSQLFEKIPYEVVFTEEDCYASAKEMREKVTATNTIYIYSGGSQHPFLSVEENLKGRAVHDVFAHMVCGCPFSFQGELNAYYEQRKHYPKEVWGTLFAEIPMQTAAYYYAGGFNFPQRAITATQTEMALCESLRKDYSHNSVLDSKKLL